MKDGLLVVRQALPVAEATLEDEVDYDADFDDFDMDAWERKCRAEDRLRSGGTQAAKGEDGRPRYRSGRYDPERREAYLARERERKAEHKARRIAAGDPRPSRPINVTGGYGKEATYRGRAMRFPIHPALTASDRLVWMTHIAFRGPATAKTLAALTGQRSPDVFGAMLALSHFGLVKGTPISSGRHGWVPMWWSVTDEGRRALWRTWQISREAVGMYTPDACVVRAVNRDPVRALRRHGRTEFLRPAALVIAFELRLNRVVSASAVTYYTQLPQTTAYNYLEKWSRLGWVEAAGEEPADRMSHRRTRRVWRWTAAADEALARHIEALWRMAVASGHVPSERELAWPYEDEDEEAEELPPAPRHRAVLDRSTGQVWCFPIDPETGEVPDWCPPGGYATAAEAERAGLEQGR